MATTTNAENLRQNKSKLSLIVEQILGFALSTNLVREVKLIFQFQTNCITIFYIIDNYHSDRWTILS